MTAGWWRRNAISLAAVALLLPLTVGVIAVNEWSAYDLGNTTQPISVPAGESAAYAGATVGPARAAFADDPAAPSGTHVVRATVLLAPGREPISCVSPLLRESGGAGRQWSEASLELERDYDPMLKSSCDSELPIRYSLTLDYLVPDDATGPFLIELYTSDELPRFVSLLVEP